MKALLKNYKLSIPVGVIVTGIVAWLAFGYFGVQGLVIDETVNEAVPTFDVTITEASGEFTSIDHETSGTATVLGDGTGQRFLRFEDLTTSNGPDVNVYLVNGSGKDFADFVDLGNLKGNVGDQNYELPADVDLGVYDTVVLWCVRFSSPFGQAQLVSA
jgi:Electron transfer DM13